MAATWCFIFFGSKIENNGFMGLSYQDSETRQPWQLIHDVFTPPSCIARVKINFLLKGLSTHDRVLRSGVRHCIHFQEKHTFSSVTKYIIRSFDTVVKAHQNPALQSKAHQSKAHQEQSPSKQAHQSKALHSHYTATAQPPPDLP